MKKLRAAMVAVTMAVTLASARIGRPEDHGMNAHRSLASALMERVLADPRIVNAVVSPASVESVLGMLAAGAAGTTRQSLNQALARVGVDVARPRPADTSRAVFATALWKERSIILEPGFEESVRKTYAARVSDIPAEHAVESINRWASDATAGRITRILDRLDPSVRVLIANAAYFKARWARPFKVEDTTLAVFTSQDGSSRPVPTMALLASLSYRKADRFSRVTLHYEGGPETLELVLPAKTADARGALGDALSSPPDSAVGRVRVQVPKFEIATDFELKPLLAALGFGAVFEPGANFGEMTRDPLHVDRIRHKAFLRVDEQGTEAAAVTAAAMVGDLPPSPADFELVLNRPFFAVLRSSPNEGPLFIAHVSKL
jgi:serpin B